MGEEFEEAVWGEVPTIGKLASLKMMARGYSRFRTVSGLHVHV
jgi:hypothetical protein